MDKEQKLIEEIVRAVRKCAQIIVVAKRSDEMVDAKEGHANFVTTYDKQVQEELKKELLAITPDAAFAGEEEESICIPKKGLTYIVDPIDGTTNFIYDYHMSCISVGVLMDYEPYMAVIYNPYLDEMYTAIAGRGAFMNGKSIHVSEGNFSSSLVAFGTAPYYEELKQESFRLAYEVLGRAADVRRSGSAALDFCAVAAGRVAMFFELRLCPWDFAAGALLVTEAGGVVTTVDGQPLDYSKKGSAIARGKGYEDEVNQLFMNKPDNIEVD